MHEYKTKKISYEGCNPVVQKHLKKGEAILCEVYDSKESLSIRPKEYIQYYSEGARLYYTLDNIYWKYAEPVIQTQTYVRKASEIVRWFEESGWEFNMDAWDSPDIGDNAFLIEMFKWCGKPKPSQYDWNPAWLKEIPTNG